MLALSISQPWAWLIVNTNKYPGGKDVENRTWMTHYRGLIAIHAPLKVDEAFFFKDDLYSFNWDRLPLSAEIMREVPKQRSDYLTGGIVGVAELVDIMTADHSPRSPWFRGPYGWVLRDACPVPFVRWKGSQGLFTVPDRLIVLEEKR
jgi:hypothetical protein